MPYLQINGENIFYKSGGSRTGNVLLAIHGSGGNHTAWPVELYNLPATRTYALDLPGHGKSDGSGCSSVAAYVNFIELFVSQLKLPEVVLMGHSLGGAIVLTLALRSPQWLSRIILVGTGARLKVAPGIMNGLLSNFEETIDLVSEWGHGPTASEMLVDRGRASLLKTKMRVTHGDFSACDQFDIMEKVSDIRLPALIISGAADQLTPLKYGEYLHRHIAGSRHRIIDDGGHMMALEKPEEFVASVADFLTT